MYRQPASAAGRKGAHTRKSGDILIFPKPFRDHGLASSSEAEEAARRAANCISNSAVNPAAAPVADATTAAHHSGGMLSRCGHFRAAATEAPISHAISSGVFQSPTTSRNDEIAFMESVLGHLVLKSKANLSHDGGEFVGDNTDMANRVSETEEKLAFIGRTRLARMARFNKQKPILIILGIDQGTYKQYETRTPLPHRFIPKFCAATGVEIDWLLTGQGAGPKMVDIPKETSRRVKKAARSRAA